ncbi:MAG: FAD-dependent thymidylate synthase [Alphaproteobacteria bacterium]|nr:FAD-dependent thymidylate synthase [Alphaproteobacteria bacterium]MDD9919092.1 FAD-dependent thymidylate synthase [Alphaproteobacteria bacterium]
MTQQNLKAVEQIAEDKSPKIFAFHDLHPEDNAMLQALYSRSPAGVLSHLEKVKKAGSGKFMASYYVGYGHASIGDCGTTTIFIENYSMLAAKAIQDSQLYSGQEASTRYLDFSEQPLYDPFGEEETSKIQQRWLDLYNEYMPQVKQALAETYPYNSEDYKTEKVWQNAINARAFDILRCLLPVGATTLFSWTTNLRQARDRLMRLRNHPLPEIKELARDLFTRLNDQYPHSFTGTEMDDNERYTERHAYEAQYGEKDHVQTFDDVIQRYQLTEAEQQKIHDGGVVYRTEHLDIAGINRDESEALQNRPDGAALPHRLKSYGVVDILCKLDFGSFRDLQRHRGGVCLLPQVDNTFGFNSWYLSQLEDLLPDNAVALKAAIQENLGELETLKTQGKSSLLLQYLYPMGMDIAVNVTYSVPQIQYVAELRSGKPVHQSLRPIAQDMVLFLKEHFPNIALYADMDKDNWTAKRGEQTIEEK